MTNWTPIELFKDGVGSWIDLTDITTLYQDREGKIPVTEIGQTVRMAYDKSGNGNHFYGEVVYMGAGREYD